MTPKQNFLETIQYGNPEYLATNLDGLNLMLDPLTGSYDGDMKDEWGCQWGYGNREYNPFPCVLPGNPVITDITKWKEQVKVPDVNTLNYTKVEQEARMTDREQLLVGMSCSAGLFERVHDLMGFEESLVAFLEEPEAMGELLDCIMEFKIAYVKRLYQATRFDLFYYHDDWGSKHALFLPPWIWREMIRPREEKIIRTVKELSQGKALFMHHSDTYLEPLIPDMIEMGIHIWQGCIPQNDIVKLQQECRGKMGFLGGIDIAAIDRKDYNEEAIREEVRRAIDTYAPHGGIVVGIPSLGALYPEVQAVYDDEIRRYSRIYNDNHFRSAGITFCTEELIPQGQYFSIPGPGYLPKYQMPVTPRENFLAVYRKELPLWIPNYYDMITLCPACYPDAISRGFVMGGEGAAYMDDSKKGGKDTFGVEWEYVPVAQGSMVRPGEPMLSDMREWKEKIILPDVDSWDWRGSAKANEKVLRDNDGLLVMWIFTGFFERLISFLDFENAAVAMIEEEQQEAVHEFFAAAVEVYKKIIRHYHTDFHADVLYLHDDWGTQRAPFFSLNTCRQMLVPYLKELVDYTHSLGMYFEFHSCGKIELLAPAMAEAGIDAWAPQENNDIKEIYNKFGSDFIVGIYSNVAPDTPEEEAYEKGKEFAVTYGSGYGERRMYWCELFNVNETYRRAIYAESRKIF